MLELKLSLCYYVLIGAGQEMMDGRPRPPCILCCRLEREAEGLIASSRAPEAPEADRANMLVMNSNLITA